ncbi:hypothetical protein FKM82_022978 [Ascaphus truei]
MICSRFDALSGLMFLHRSACDKPLQSIKPFNSHSAPMSPINVPWCLLYCGPNKAGLDPRHRQTPRSKGDIHSSTLGLPLLYSS